MISGHYGKKFLPHQETSRILTLMLTDALTDTMKTASKAVSGSETPEALTATSREHWLTVWMRTLAGPAISAMVIAIVANLSWGGVIGLWTSASEETRATYVGMIGIALSVMLGVALWVLLVGRPARLEVRAGPGSVVINGEDNAQST